MEQVLKEFKTGGGMIWKSLWELIFGYTISTGT